MCQFTPPDTHVHNTVCTTSLTTKHNRFITHHYFTLKADLTKLPRRCLIDNRELKDKDEVRDDDDVCWLGKDSKRERQFRREKGNLRYRRPCQGVGRGRGKGMSPVWILKRLVSSVFINACRLLLALPSPSQFGRGRLSLVAISFYALCYFLGHVACRNLPWQGLIQSVGRSTTTSMNVNTNLKLWCSYTTKFFAMASFKTMQDLIF